MDELCGSKYWDLQKTWNTDNPYFTQCFEQTVLVWIPCAFLWIFAIVDIYLSCQTVNKKCPWTFFNVVKILFTLCLIACDILRFINLLRSDYRATDSKSEGLFIWSSEIVYDAEFIGPAVKICSYVLYLCLFLIAKSKGTRSSGVQFVFWLLLALCEAIKFRTVITNTQFADAFPFVIDVLYFLIVLGQLLLHCWSDVTIPTAENFKFQSNGKKECPEESASYVSRLLFHWYNDLAWTGFRRPLQDSDLWQLEDCDTSATIVPLFDHYWAKEVARKNKKSRKQHSPKTKKSYTSLMNSDDQKRTPSYNVLSVLIDCFGTTFFFGCAIKLIPDVLAFVSPQVLGLLISFADSDEPIWKGLMYAAIMFITSFLTSIFSAQFSHRMYLTGLRIRTALVSAVYKKALRVSNSVKKEYTVGEIVNLMSVDVQKVMDVTPFFMMLGSALFQISLAMYFLWNIIGPSAIAGLVVMLMVLPINAMIAAKAKAYQVTQMQKKDERVKLINEMLTGIKILKLYAWEPSFEDEVLKIRKSEIEVLKKGAILNFVVANVLWSCCTFLVTAASFGTFVLSDENNILDASTAFVSLSLFNIISVPLSFLSLIILNLVQAVVSMKRLNKFMSCSEVKDYVTHDPKEGDPIVIKDGNFTWDDEDNVSLRNINLRVKKGSLVAVVGSVGCGKSSLLSAILGEMDICSGSVNTIGSIGYVPQQAWIQNLSLKNNILFGKPFEAAKYEKIINACALRPDLEILPAKDETEIGEKGINLSGGQKQRVSLARASYWNADIYLLDDPLSAVDSHVGKHIFNKVIGPKGILKRKTRIFVTHGISNLPHVDQIFVMKNGQISEYGTYKELLDRKGAFAEFLTQHMTAEDVSEMEGTSMISDIETVVGDLEQIKSRKRLDASHGHGSDSENIISSSFSDRKKQMDSHSRQTSVVPEHQKNVEQLIVAEKSETKSVSFSVYMDYLRAAGWSSAFWTFVFFIGYQGFSIGANMWLSEWSNQAEKNDKTNATSIDLADDTNYYFRIYLIFGLLQAVSMLIGSFLLVKATINSSLRLHSDMLHRLLRAPMSFFDTTPIGRIINRFGKDVDICDSGLPLFIRFWIIGFLQVCATLVVISYSTPIFIAVVIPIIVVYYFVQQFYVSSSRQLKRLESVSRSPIYSHFGETISGVSTIRAYGEEPRFIAESEKRVDINQMAYFPNVTSNRWLAIRLENIGNTVVFFAALFAVLGRETLNPGLVGLSVSYALQITLSLIMLVRWTSEIEANIVAVERIKEYTTCAQEAKWKIDGQTPTKEWPQEGNVKFDHYKTRYRPGLDLVLKDVTCNIAPKEKIGIVGRTGAGKSSLTLALFRIIEASGGSIIIDGQNIGKLGLHDVRSRITIIPQEPILFSGTLRMNLDPFKAYSDQSIWHALELAHLKSFVQGLSAGLEHGIVEAGDNLSVGQRQLVCLARALLRKTKILVLDEATAAVDLETDDLIQKTIRSEFKDSTVITIAHRLNTIMDSTRVMVLDDGRIVEFDSPDELMKNPKSLFYSMAKDAGIQLF